MMIVVSDNLPVADTAAVVRGVSQPGPSLPHLAHGEDDECDDEDEEDDGDDGAEDHGEPREGCRTVSCVVRQEHVTRGCRVWLFT